MNLVLVFGCWLGLSVVVSMILGAVIAYGNRRSGRTATSETAHSRRPRSSDEYLVISTVEWSAAAQRVAMDALYSTDPVVIRRVATHRPGSDG